MHWTAHNTSDLAPLWEREALIACREEEEEEEEKSLRERERLQCFTQPASLITYRRRQRSTVDNIKTVKNELENLHMTLLKKKKKKIFTCFGQTTRPITCNRA